MRIPMMKKILARSIVLCFFAGILFVIGANRVILAYNNDIAHTVSEAPVGAVAMIFGGGMKDTHSMSDMQEDRVLQGVMLYKSGKAKKLLMTGDDGTMRVDEVDAMREYAIARGVPSDDVLVDPRGYTTYASCVRAGSVYGVTTTIAVSQSFHLPRIRYFCEHAGIRTFGLSADLRAYPNVWVGGLREVLARVKAWIWVSW